MSHVLKKGAASGAPKHFIETSRQKIGNLTIKSLK